MMNILLYLGPGLGLGTILLVLVILLIVLSSLIIIIWTPIKKIIRKLKRKPKTES